MGEDIRSIGILGAGVMGAGMTMACAEAGFDVILRDIDDSALERARQGMHESYFGWQRGVELGKITPEEVKAAEQRITCTLDAEALADVDVLIEAIPEDEDLKKIVFHEFDELVQPGAIFATNTSGFAIASLCEIVRRRDRFVGMHWFHPANIVELIEVVYTAESSEASIVTIEELSRRLGKRTIRVKDAPGSYGFVANRVFYAALAEARRLVEAGIASEEDVDTAMRLGCNWPAGPFEKLRGQVTGWE